MLLVNVHFFISIQPSFYTHVLRKIIFTFLFSFYLSTPLHNLATEYYNQKLLIKESRGIFRSNNCIDNYLNTRNNIMLMTLQIFNKLISCIGLRADTIASFRIQQHVFILYLTYFICNLIPINSELRIRIGGSFKNKFSMLDHSEKIISLSNAYYISFEY